MHAFATSRPSFHQVDLKAIGKLDELVVYFGSVTDLYRLTTDIPSASHVFLRLGVTLN